MAYLWADQYETALPCLERAVRINPDLGWFQMDVAACHTQLGNHEEAIKRLQQFVRSNPRHLLAASQLACAHWRAGRKDEARKIAEQILEWNTPEQISRWTLAERHHKQSDMPFVYLAMDDVEEAVRWLDKALVSRHEWLLLAHVQPQLDPWRQHPAMEAFLRRVTAAMQ